MSKITVCAHKGGGILCNDCFASSFTALVGMKLEESKQPIAPPGVLQQLAAMDEFSQHLEEDFKKSQPDYVWDVFSPEFLRQT